MNNHVTPAWIGVRMHSCEAGKSRLPDVKKQLLSEMCEDQHYPKPFIKKNIINHSYLQFHPN